MPLTTDDDIANAGKQNSSRLCLKFELPGGTHMASMAKALEAHGDFPAVKKVIFACTSGGASLFSKEFDAFVQVVAASLPSLEHVCFFSWEERNDYFRSWLPGKSIATFLKSKATQLKTIEFGSTGIVCENTADFHRFCEVVGSMASLDSCKFGTGFSVLQGTDYENMHTVRNLTPLYDKIPATRKVTLRLRAPSERNSEQRNNDFRSVFRNGITEELHLRKIRPCDPHAMTDVADGLSSSLSTIRVLELEFHWCTPFIMTEDPTGPYWSKWQRLAHAIASSTTLETVTVRFDSDNEFPDNDKSTKLDCFMFLLAERMADHAKSSALKRLSVGPCPQHFEDPKEKSPRALFEKYNEMLEVHTSIEELDIDDDDELSWYIEEMDYYRLSNQKEMLLKLNRNGRKRFFRNPSKIALEEWVTLFQQLDDSQCINYYLTRFPWLINTGYEIKQESEDDED